MGREPSEIQRQAKYCDSQASHDITETKLLRLDFVVNFQN